MPTAEVNGQRINYEITGNGIPVVLITGFASDMSFWDALTPALSDKYKVITLDNRGAGKTSYNGKFTIYDMADDVVALMDHLSIYKAHIVGWSMGGCMAQEIALKHPERVISLTLVSAYMKRPARSSYVMRTMIKAVAEGARVETLSMVLQVMCFPESVFLKREEKGVRENKAYIAGINGITDQLDAVDAYDSREHVSKISVPTLCVIGMSDIMVPPEVGEKIASLIKNSKQYRVPGAGHIINPSTYVRTMLEHLKENE
ncbi:MAG: alpha/beta hydrolase [Methanomassiliicoccaceae archaeon]|nr:alpha/beta hydrolase [Methanomassiliicoccaceae archaeon]